jgi:2-C-methyl-D-erythritol 4-phosphate cytidylyltransferase
MQTDINIGVVIPAGGSGLRFGGPVPKQYLDIQGVPSIVRSIRTILDLVSCTSIVIAAAEEQHAHLLDLLTTFHVSDARVHIVAGGSERQESVLKALRHESLFAADIIAVHDAVRPLASADLWRRVLGAAQLHGSAIPVIPITDTLKRVHEGVIVETIDRASLRRVQTPQAFTSDVLRRAYQAAQAQGWTGTDCASLCEQLGVVVHCVDGEDSNIKITTPFDVVLAELFLSRN